MGSDIRFRQETLKLMFDLGFIHWSGITLYFVPVDLEESEVEGTGLLEIIMD